jgi:hypothetical protein
VLFWKRAALPFAVAVGLVVVVVVVVVVAMVGIIVVVASESCCCVRIDVKRISIFLDFNIYHNIIKNLFRKVSLVFDKFFS